MAARKTEMNTSPQSGNGLLDVDKIPLHMMPISERNTKDSPLLRLPGEIRNMIFKYAMTGGVVEVTIDEDRCVFDEEADAYAKMYFKGRAVGPKMHRTALERLEADPCDTPTAPSAFHLPEVCRQIYTETATLAYSGNIFYLRHGYLEWYEFFHEWSDGLIPAQRDAVTDIAVDQYFMHSYLIFYPNSSFRVGLPGLKRVHLRYRDFFLMSSWLIDNHDSSWLSDYHDSPSDEVAAGEYAKRWIQKMVLEREGDGVEVVFYQAHPSVEVLFGDLSDCDMVAEGDV